MLRERAEAEGLGNIILPGLADVTRLPFGNDSFDSASTAETLEHVPEHDTAAAEFARVLRPDGWLVGTVPAGPRQWSDWDDWADHQRRYRPGEMAALLRDAGLNPAVKVYGWPPFRPGSVIVWPTNRRIGLFGLSAP